MPFYNKVKQQYSISNSERVCTIYIWKKQQLHDLTNTRVSSRRSRRRKNSNNNNNNQAAANSHIYNIYFIVVSSHIFTHIFFLHIFIYKNILGRVAVCVWVFVSNLCYFYYVECMHWLPVSSLWNQIKLTFLLFSVWDYTCNNRERIMCGIHATSVFVTSVSVKFLF